MRISKTLLYCGIYLFLCVELAFTFMLGEPWPTFNMPSFGDTYPAGGEQAGNDVFRETDVFFLVLDGSSDTVRLTVSELLHDLPWQYQPRQVGYHFSRAMTYQDIQKPYQIFNPLRNSINHWKFVHSDVRTREFQQWLTDRLRFCSGRDSLQGLIVRTIEYERHGNEKTTRRVQDLHYPL